MQQGNLLKAIRNTMANYVGGISGLAATLVFNALYFRILDEEAFGVASLLLTVSMLIPALDLGTGRTAGRIIADRLARASDGTELRDAVLTLELTNASIGAGLGAGLALAAPAVAGGWLRPDALPTGEVATAVELLGALLALMMPKNFAVACLNGMKRQALSNLLLVSFTLLRGVAGLTAILVAGDPMLAFFAAQILVQVAETLTCSATAWWLLPAAPRRPRLEPAALRRVWRFAAGDGFANLIGALMGQGDKILLSTLLPLSAYGSYALVSTVAMGIGRFTGPFSSAFLPHFVELIALNRKEELRGDYLVATQMLSCVIVPIAAVMILFAPDILSVVLGIAQPLDQLPLAFSLLVAATIMNNLMHLPHGVQLAAGNSTTGLYFTAANAAAYFVLVVLLTPRLGVIAPALSMLAVAAVASVFFVRVTHHMLDLPVHRWALRSVLRPAVPAIFVAAAASFLVPSGAGLLAVAAWLVASTLAASAASLAVSREVRFALRRLVASRMARDGPSGNGVD